MGQALPARPGLGAGVLSAAGLRGPGARIHGRGHPPSTDATRGGLNHRFQLLLERRARKEAFRLKAKHAHSSAAETRPARGLYPGRPDGAGAPDRHPRPGTRSSKTPFARSAFLCALCVPKRLFVRRRTSAAAAPPLAHSPSGLRSPSAGPFQGRIGTTDRLFLGEPSITRSL